MLSRAFPAAAAAALALAGAASAFFAAGPPTVRGATTTTGTVATTTTTTSTSTPVTVPASSVLVLNGHGWGHGLGMSQWGAYGFARHGWTYDRILAYYYRGTALGPAPVTRVRVLLFEGAKKATLAAPGAWRATDSAGTVVDLAAGPLALTPALKVKNKLLQAPVTFTSQSSALTVGGRPYRGSVVVSTDKGKLQVVNAVGLEAYLKGVVPSEMPSAWPEEALKAQAVAARSYAVANLAKGRSYDLYSDVRSQVYGGLNAESETASAAADATAGEVVLYDGKVATTYFFSTSGGRTLSALEATGHAVPYLVSVPDPYDDASPHHNWGPVVVDAAKASRELAVPPPLVDLRLTLGASGRVAKGAAVTPLGERLFTGPQLRTLLGLRSTWFSVGWLTLTPPAAPMIYGGAASLAGTARSVGPATLEARPLGGVWQTVTTLAPDTTGAFRKIVRPRVTSDYRLAAGDVRAAVARVPVAPRVVAKIDASTASGEIRPVVAGAAVQLQRQDGTKWSTVTSGTTDDGGAFSLESDPAPGSYRVRVAPGGGLVPGYSRTFVP